MAERLAAEQVVALQVATHRLQEAQHEGGAGGGGKLDHADAAVRPHWHQEQPVVS